MNKTSLGDPSASIVIKGARENNLRDATVSMPRGKLIGVTGVSGSGKSSLVFDVLAAEGHRKYVESLSPKARQALEKVRRPDVDYVEGLSPVISIEQVSAGGAGPRSTVATATEVADYARLLWANVGLPHCPLDGGLVTRRSLDDCVNRILEEPSGSRIMLLAPWMSAKASVLLEEFPNLERRGFQRVRIDGEVKRLDDRDLIPAGTRGRELFVDLVVDRLVLDDSARSRLADSLELAFREGGERALILVSKRKGDAFHEFAVSQAYSCEVCGETYPALTPRLFSWNNPDGACSNCGGLGEVLRFREDLVIPDSSIAIGKGAIKPWRLGSRRMIIQRNAILRQLAEQVPFDLKKNWGDLPPKIQNTLLYGDDKRKYNFKLKRGRAKPEEVLFDGVFADLEHSMLTTSSDGLRSRLLAYQVGSVCQECEGRRLSAYSRSILLGGRSFSSFLELSAGDAWAFVRDEVLGSGEYALVSDAVAGLEQRLRFLCEVGLGYLDLNRPYGTLSGGEAQRARLATQLGMGLVGVTYALDEPSVGLHSADHRRLLNVLLGLRDRGNTVVVVEHDADTLLSADHLLEVGPGAGAEGGRIVFTGSVQECLSSDQSNTGPFLTGLDRVGKDAKAKEPGRGQLIIRGATANNLRQVDAAFPVGLLTVVCGVSGSGKSTLVNEVLAKAAAFRLHRAKQIPGAHTELEGLEQFQKAVRVDQSPIGRSPRSNPATYVKLFDGLRKLFAKCSLSRIRGYGPGRFSFNVAGGRCERCKGDGSVKLDMQFLADVFVECESCRGKRYNRETLEVRFRGYNVAEVLDMTVSEAKDLLAKQPAIASKLETLDAVGLGYLCLGQPANTLSGGEAQRLKLSLELSRRQEGGVLYLLDEPTTGLHWADVQRLMDLLFKLRDAGNTIVVVEHHLDVVRLADHLLEMGPGGGSDGGNLIFAGNPSMLAESGTSTGTCLKEYLERIDSRKKRSNSY
ncbi:MAG: excinuclease ABC subunit A [Opitutae bacterium]|nr:excinuclease ABC subunit A [Opitutae bacterium]